jgi:mRNA interferase RelE/StbE
VKYQIVVSRAADKFMMRLTPRDYVALRQAITSLSDEPWGIHTNKVVGSDLWRLRVGRYRVIYFVDDKEKVIYVERIAPRNEKTYKGL